MRDVARSRMRVSDLAPCMKDCRSSRACLNVLCVSSGRLVRTVSSVFFRREMRLMFAIGICAFFALELELFMDVGMSVFRTI